MRARFRKPPFAPARPARLSAQPASPTCWLFAFLTRSPAPRPVAPSAKRARGLITDVSDEYAKALVAEAPRSLSTAADVRRYLAEPLSTPVLVDESHATLLADSTGCFPMKPRAPTRSMAELEALLESAYRWHVASGNEEVWATLADLLTGHVWRTLSKLAGTFTYIDNRNSSDRSGATQRMLRPDYCGWISHMLVVKAEHRIHSEQLEDALNLLLSKMNGWNALVMRGLPFLPCFAVGGHLLQFAIVFGGPGGSACIERVTEPMPMSSGRDRLRIVEMSVKFFSILAMLRTKIPAHVIPLYEEQRRADGGSVTVFADHVIKRCIRTAPAAVYEALKAGEIPHAVCVIEHKPLYGTSKLAYLKLQPVCVEVLPSDEAQLRRALIAVLRALFELHARGFVHRDVRWPNVLADGSGGWVLVDFELADVAGSLLPAGAIDPNFLAPEVRAAGAKYTPAADAWQVGGLLKSAGIQLSQPAMALAESLTAPLEARLSVALALAHPWLVGDAP